MFILESTISAFSLSLDAFAAALCLGVSLTSVIRRTAIHMSITCGTFQFAMPIFGWYLGTYAINAIAAFDHWVAFGLLALVGGNMIRNSFLPPEECSNMDSIRLAVLLYLGLATSIDAFAVGASFALVEKPVLWLAVTSGLVTFVLCFAGVCAGRLVGCKLGKRVELAGGVFLFLIGLNILRTHL